MPDLYRISHILLDTSRNLIFTSFDQTLADTIVTYLLNYAKTQFALSSQKGLMLRQKNV